MTVQRERQVGITEYVTQQPGFRASLKTIFRDFIVHEVDATGNVLCLWSEAAADASLQEQETTESTGRSLASIRDALAAAFDSEDTERILDFIRQIEDPTGEDGLASQPTTLTLSACGDKDVRRARHAALRLLSPHFASTTDESQRIQLYRTKIDGTALSRATSKRISPPEADARVAKWQRALNTRERCARLGGNYLRFLLCKQNLDTTEVIMRLARALGTKPAAFSHAGTKDRRGVTTQEMRVRNTTVTRLQQAAERAFGPASADSGTPQIRMGGFRYTNEPLRLGQLQGNLFRIVLRCLQPSEEALIRNALIDLQTYGFINYFGLQRFGSGQTPTHHIGIALLQGNWRKALDLILTGSLLSPMDDEAPSTRTELLRPILETYLRDRDATSALAQMDALPRPLQRGLHLERRLLQAECRYGTKDLQAIFHSLPRNLRTLYLHAVQSYVWNEMASERIRQFGAREVHPGDLVAMKSPTPGTGHLDLGEAGSTDNADDPALLDCSEDSSLPLHTESPESGSSERDVALIHEVTAADVALQRYTIYDVVLPVPGLSTGTISCPAAAQAYCRFVDAYQVALIGDEASALGRQYCMRGTYRRLLIRPAEMHHRFIRHETLREPLTKTDLDVYPVHENNEHDDTATNDASRPFLACEIRFRLPASSYATMLLRELTKSETDRWTQSRQVTEPSTALASHALSLLNSGNDSKSPK